MCLLVLHRVGHIYMCMQTAQLHHSNTWKHAHYQPKDCCRLVNSHKAKQHIFPSNFEFARYFFSTFSWFKKHTLRGGNFQSLPEVVISPDYGMLFIPSSQNLARQVLFRASCLAKVRTIVSVRSHDSCWSPQLQKWPNGHVFFSTPMKRGTTLDTEVQWSSGFTHIITVPGLYLTDSRKSQINSRQVLHVWTHLLHKHLCRYKLSV